MSELISNKQAYLDFIENIEVQTRKDANSEWKDLNYGMTLAVFVNDEREFRRKPSKVTHFIIEVPTPFTPKEGEIYWHIDTSQPKGYHFNNKLDRYSIFGVWRTEDEVKLVVAAINGVSLKCQK